MAAAAIRNGYWAYSVDAQPGGISRSVAAGRGARRTLGEKEVRAEIAPSWQGNCLLAPSSHGSPAQAAPGDEGGERSQSYGDGGEASLSAQKVESCRQHHHHE